MNYKVVYSRRFIKSLKRVTNYPGFKNEKLILAITLLAAGEPLPEQFRDHSLSGDLEKYREFHIASDILVIYELQDDILELLLVNVGSHSQLFT